MSDPVPFLRLSDEALHQHAANEIEYLRSVLEAIAGVSVNGPGAATYCAEQARSALSPERESDG